MNIGLLQIECSIRSAKRCARRRTFPKRSPPSKAGIMGFDKETERVRRWASRSVLWLREDVRTRTSLVRYGSMSVPSRGNHVVFHRERNAGPVWAGCRDQGREWDRGGPDMARTPDRGVFQEGRGGGEGGEAEAEHAARRTVWHASQSSPPSDTHTN